LKGKFMATPAAAPSQKAVIMPIVFKPAFTEIFTGDKNHPKRSPMNGDTTIINMLSSEIAVGFAKLG
jgi:hypothetical protein